MLIEVWRRDGIGHGRRVTAKAPRSPRKRREEKILILDWSPGIPAWVFSLGRAEFDL
jgi:hypothetical protein